MGSFSQKFLFFFLLTIQSFVWETISFEDNPTAYEILRDFNFPTGLLPAGVTGYDFDPLSGKFSAFLNGTCTFTLQGAYKLRYKNTINGYISKGRLARLEGVSLKFLFFWVNVVEVLRKGDELEFSVGVAAAGFPMDDFDDSPQCECRFLKCSNQKVRKIGEMNYVSS
ncbi:serine/threonine protein phosphatase [Hibiscus syriacus]|uniref:Serine/threonine protein phosphatase n=1 Tax=Hibiscus syriacus TaxID=106335 RepID=A0A6A2Z842_HIBSY|nr:uncharacterized protein At5g01610-like [Hibiscus syriacus]KAE8687275.1 serine/threonine protein phosphatase [Hibiscus syriacus]